MGACMGGSGNITAGSGTLWDEGGFHQSRLDNRERLSHLGRSLPVFYGARELTAVVKGEAR